MKENMMENRLQNLLWTVSEDYNCDVKINPADLQKSPEILYFYDRVQKRYLNIWHKY